MDMGVIKGIVRVLAALFVAFFGSLQLSMTVCHLASSPLWARWLCGSYPTVSLLLSFASLFALTLLILSRKYAAFRRPLAIVLLLVYALYGVREAYGYGLWWYALVLVAALAAAIGIALRARWGTLVVSAISALFVVYWSWSVGAGFLAGVLQSNPPLVAALMFVPGIAFGLLAGFCCYVLRGQATRLV